MSDLPEMPKKGRMEKMDAVRLALIELGEATAEQVAAFTSAHFGVKVQPKFVPIIRASLRDKEMLASARRQRAIESPPAATPTAPAATDPS